MMPVNPDPFETEHRLTELESKQDSVVEDLEGLGNKVDVLFSAISDIKTTLKVNAVKIQSSFDGMDVRLTQLTDDLKKEMNQHASSLGFKRIMTAAAAIGTLIGGILTGALEAFTFFHRSKP